MMPSANSRRHYNSTLPTRPRVITSTRSRRGRTETHRPAVAAAPPARTPQPALASVGVRPSPAAAALDLGRAWSESNAEGTPEIAAAGDGRTPTESLPMVIAPLRIQTAQ